MRSVCPTSLRAVAALAALLACAPAAAMTPPPSLPPGPPGGGAPAPRPVIYRMEVLRIAKPGPDVIAGLQPLKTLPEVEAFLKQRDIAYGWSRGDVASAGLPSGLVQMLNRLAPNTVFALPEGDAVLAIGMIVGTRMAEP